jgi:hypothetical protein
MSQHTTAQYKECVAIRHSTKPKGLSNKQSIDRVVEWFAAIERAEVAVV